MSFGWAIAAGGYADLRTALSRGIASMWECAGEPNCSVNSLGDAGLAANTRRWRAGKHRGLSVPA